MTITPRGLPPGCGTPTTRTGRGGSALRRPALLQRRQGSGSASYIKGNGEGERIVDPVKYWREKISDGGGLQVKITGGAGFSADAIEVFEGINGTLLLAARSAS